MIYDCFTFFNELEILKIRLNELDDCIDYFVLVEATQTFSGHPKPLFFEKNKQLFKKFLPKIIYIVVKDIEQAPSIENSSFYKQNSFMKKNPQTWAREVFQRNCITRGLSKAEKDDIILIGDVDEIPRKTFIKKLSNIGSSIIAFEQKSYYYYLNCQSNENIIGTKAVTKDFLNYHSPQDIRISQNQTLIKNGGWHFTYLGQAKKIIKKINAYSHQELNTKETNNAKRIQLYVENNLDIFGRNFIIKTVPVDKTFPLYVQTHRNTLKKYIKKERIIDLNTSMLLNEIIHLKKENEEKNNQYLKIKKKYIKTKNLSNANKMLLQDRISEINKLTTCKWYRIQRKYHKIKNIILNFVFFFLKLIASTLYFIFISIFFIFSFIVKKFFQKKPKPLIIDTSQQALDGITFIIPTWDKEKMVINCLDNLISTLRNDIKKTKIEIIVIDNGSKDNTSTLVKKIKSNKNIIIRLISLKRNLGFAKAINLGAKRAKYNYLYLLNNDMFVQPGFLKNIIFFAKKYIKNNKKFFALSSQIFFADKTKRRQESGKNYIKVNFGFLYVAHLLKQINLEDPSFTAYAGGGSSLINKHLFQKLGGYDYQSYTPLYCEDLDISFNAWRYGFPSIFIPQSQVIHNHQSSSKKLTRNPEFYMYKNYLVFLLKNLDSPKLIIHHLFFYPILMLLDKKYIEYANLALKNIRAIFHSRQRLNRFQTKYTDKQLINFLDFETNLNVKL